jgi:hypothetical protein
LSQRNEILNWRAIAVNGLSIGLQIASLQRPGIGSARDFMAY